MLLLRFIDKCDLYHYFMQIIVTLHELDESI